MQIVPVSFDLPTRMGHDSDHPLSEGEVGKTGVAIDSIDDMQTLFHGIRLENVSTSMAIDATGYILLAFYAALAKQQGADWKKITGTIQNDILGEYAARGTYIYPPRPSMRIITDIFEWCGQELPRWNLLSISGCPMRAAGSTALQELAFTLSNGKAYVQAAMERGLDIDVFGKQLSFSFNAHNNNFEEIAKLRAARRMWAHILQDLGATDPLPGSYDVEPLTREMETAAWQLIDHIDRMGGSVCAIEQGFIQEEIARSAREYQQFDSPRAIPVVQVDDSIRQMQVEKLNALKRRRDPARVDSILQELNDKAASDENIMPTVVEAVERLCTLGEIADTLREVFGEYR